jgi:hypothetical protein
MYAIIYGKKQAGTPKYSHVTLNDLAGYKCPDGLDIFGILAVLNEADAKRTVEKRIAYLNEHPDIRPFKQAEIDETLEDILEHH